MARVSRTPDQGGYLLDNRVRAAGDRFVAMAELFDPVTMRHVEALGIGRGARIWEVGAGGAALPAALARVAGPDGRVLATDIDTTWLDDTAAGGAFEVRRHDVGTEPPPDPPFDLVHARLVLVHLPDRAAALTAMVSALAPGGVLLVEDADPALQPLACPDETGPAEALANRIRHAFRGLLADRGADLSFGRSLPRLLREAGLADIGAECWFPLASPALAPLEAATVAHVRAGLEDSGLVAAAEVDEHLANVAAGILDLATAPLVSAWGRRR
jgi:SAM-dependent methyltransferase